MSMRISLYGGFGEKGRTCLAVQANGSRLLLDAGVKTSAYGQADYYPAIPDQDLRTASAIVVTHAHEDHVAALGHFLERGFAGRTLMTAPTQDDCEALIAGYGAANEAARFRSATVEHLPVGNDAARIGPFTVHTGRSGHIAGGVWCIVDDGATRFGYCGDVASQSPVFAMDPLPRCDALAIDASYGDDATPFAARAAQILEWVDAHDAGCILPTPQYGRSLELFALLAGRAVLAPGMRDALAVQVIATQWLHGDPSRLVRQLDASHEWAHGEPLPAAPILCHDGMGMYGPSRDLLAQAERTGHPVLFTGHVPKDSPGDRLRAMDRADWIRLPTHPTLGDNLHFVSATQAALVLAHSCERDALDPLARHIAQLRLAVTGDHVDIG